jgi:class 3 adenylate cyclase
VQGPRLELPPSDADRARVIEALRRASPQLGFEEVERRMNLALQAPTLGELLLLSWDLPPPDDVVAAPGKQRVSVWRSATFRVHAAAYSLTNGFLVGTWALTGHGFFWPFFPIAGWGIGLGMHAVGTRQAQRHDLEKGRERELTDAAAGEPAKELPGPPNVRTDDEHPEAMRTQVAVMFTDIVDSTRLTALIGDENWTRVRARHREMLGRCYDRHGGRKVNSIGDGFLARFESVREAVLCATEILRGLDTERRETGFAPSVRIGINAGDAIDEDGDLLGTVVNVASRITAAANANEILITETVADRLDGHFTIVDRGLRELKGLDRSLHVLSVDWLA